MPKRPRDRSAAAPAARPRVLAAAVCAVLVAAFAPLARAAPPHVILVSLDGTRPVDVTDADLGAVASIRRTGAAAASMIGVSPSNTFPSHVSLVTGVAPERHGLVNNAFFDPERGEFEKQDIPSWIEVEPLWSWLAARGVVSASYYWVGSEGPWPPSGRGPRHWERFSSRTGEAKKVEQILAWLDLQDEAEHPRFVSSWFHGADHAGHHEGPGTPAVRESLRAQNVAIEALVAGLESRGAFAYTTLLFVSDHGMTRAEREVDLGGRLRSAGVRARVRGIGGFASVYLSTPASGDDAAAQVQQVVEVARGEGLEAYAREAAPPDWRVRHRRFGDVVVRAPVGVAITHRGLSIEGFHGYAPDAPSMRAILFARGRGARPGTDLGVVRTIDVAPTVVHLLGLEPPEWMEGRVIEGLRIDGVPGAAPSARLGRSEGIEQGGAE